MIILEPSAIVNILTLRYNPLQKPPIPKLDASEISNTRYVSKEEVRDVLKNIINYRLASKKRIALALSSGIDSTLSLAMIRDAFPDMKIDCLCAVFDEESECKCAYEIASRFDANFHIIDFEAINILDEMPLQLSIVEEPRWNLYFYYVVKEASRYSDTLITGDGGDELFGGYTFRYSKFLRLINTKDSWRDKAMIYLQCHERDHVPDQSDLFGPKIEFRWDDILELFRAYFDNDLDPLQQVFLADFNGKLLFDWIPTNNKLFKYFNIQGISPFLDPNLIKTATKIDPIQKFDRENGKGKIILRELLSDYNIILNDNKIGFSLNTREVWLRNREIFEYYLCDARIVRDEWINGKWIDRTLKMLREDKDADIRYINKMLGLLAFEVWYRLFISNEMNASTRL